MLALDLLDTYLDFGRQIMANCLIPVEPAAAQRRTPLEQHQALSARTVTASSNLQGRLVELRAAAGCGHVAAALAPHVGQWMCALAGSL